MDRQQQKTIFVTVACVVVGLVLLFFALPCGVTGYMLYRFQEEQEREQQHLEQKKLEQQKLRDLRRSLP